MDPGANEFSMRDRVPTGAPFAQHIENSNGTLNRIPTSRSLGFNRIQADTRRMTMASMLEYPEAPVEEIQPQMESSQDQMGGPINRIEDTKVLEFDDLTYMENTEASYLEIYNYPTAESRVFQGKLDDSNYEDWLNQGAFVNKGEVPSSGCRLILTRRPQYGLATLIPMMIRRDHLKQTVEKWDLDLNFPEQMILWTTLTKMTKIPEKPFKLISRLINGTDQGSSASLISFDPETNITRGIVIGLYSDQQTQDYADDWVVWENHMFQMRIRESIQWTWHPVAHLIVQIDEMIRYFQLIARLTSIRVVELSHSAGLMQMTTKNQMVPLKEALARDYTSDTSALAIQSVQMAMCQTALDSNMSVLEDLVNYIDEIEAVAPGTKMVRPYLISEINNLKSRCRSSLLFTQGLQRQISFTQTAIYNLIAQRDSKLNLELARDSRMLAVASKRDSSSMKTIAILTIAFLPGTFVSAVFAMPLFDWEATEYSKIPTDKFWVFLAVTLPMTFLIILAWFVWDRRQSWLKSKDHEEGMKTFEDVDVEKEAAMEATDPEKVPLTTEYQDDKSVFKPSKPRSSWKSWNRLFAKKQNIADHKTYDE